MIRMLDLRLLALLGVLVAASLTTACSPSLSPLYRDYQVPTDTTYTAADTTRIKSALREAGWTIRTSGKTDVIATVPRVVDNWLLYKVEVDIETVAINDTYLRLYVHPRRQYITGGQTKISFLKESLQDELMPPLTEAFNKYGFTRVGLAEERDRRPGG